AARAFRRALELDPDRPAVRQNYGKLLRDMNRLQESEKELRLALSQTDAQDARTRTSLALTLVRLGKTTEPGPLVADPLRIDPKDPQPLAAEGLLQAAEGRLDEAAHSLEAVADGGDADTRIELARVYLRRGDMARARAAVDAVLAVNPGHPWALAVLGEALVRQGQRDEGLTVLRRAVAARPRRPEAWLSLADGFEAGRDTAEAARRPPGGPR